MSKQVMVVEDELGVRTLLSLMLERRGFSVLRASDAREAFALLEETTPDLFVLDIILPDMDGTDLCRKLRANKRTAERPILILSARSDLRSTEGSIRAGASDYLLKPVLHKDLIEKVHRLIGVSEEDSKACA